MSLIRPTDDDDFPGAVLDAAESQHLIQELVDFVVGDGGETSVSIGELRRVMDEQIGRARRRMRGIEQINELLRSRVGVGPISICIWVYLQKVK